MKSLFVLLLSALLLVAGFSHAQVKITDTIFYNDKWAICEQETAVYYRAGTLAAIDSFWYYTGKVKDYTTKDELLMEGEYTFDGRKTGKFLFYYPHGNLRCSGSFLNDKMIGLWNWYHLSGELEATIYFNGEDQGFQFIHYRDEKGNQLMKDGVGEFRWETTAFDSRHRGYLAQGSFHMGKRAGTWVFSNPTLERANVVFREKYDKEGNFQKTVFTNTNYSTKRPAPFFFVPVKLYVTEQIAYDDFFRMNGDSMATMSLLNYLIDRRSTTITSKNQQFDTAFVFMLRTLYQYRDHFDDRSKDLDARIEFKIGENKTPEDITVTGNLDSTEKAYLVFLMKKFQNIDMPSHESIAWEAYHSIYIYSIDITPYFPAEIKITAGNELFITALPKEKMIALLEASKKTIKKFVRKNYLRF